ncbi:MAG: nucleotidyltransferase family protein [Myxococcota bacterium]
MLSFGSEGPVTAVVLCAGGSRRMGEPKGLRPVPAGAPLLRAHVDVFEAAGMPVVVVLGYEVEAHRAVLPASVRVVVNAAWETTAMAESAALALADLGAVLLTPVDVPPARADTLARLLATPGDVVPAWRGADGHPVKLVPPHPPGRLDARLRHAARVPVDDPDCVRNLNTPAEWEAWVGARG